MTPTPAMRPRPRRATTTATVAARWQSSTPRQRRSEETMDRFAEAAEELLRTKPFEEIAVQDIVRRAGRPIGSFYARFGSKDAILPFLYQRYHRGLEPLFASRLARVDWQALEFADTAAALVDFLLAVYDERRWLLRALALFTRTRPEAMPADLIRQRRRVFDLVTQVLMRHRAHVAHANPEAAIRFAFFVVSSVAREKLLFGEAPHARVTAIGRKQLRDELVRLLTTYLSVGVPR